MYTEAQNRAVQKYIKTHYDRIVIRVQKGEKAKYQEAAAAAGISLNSLITSAIREKIERLPEDPEKE